MSKNEPGRGSMARGGEPRILVMRFSSLGDVVLSMVLLDAIAERIPGAQVGFATKDAYRGLLEDDPRVDRLHLLAPGDPLPRFASQLRAADYDLVLDAHGSLRSRALGAMLAPVELRRVNKATFDRFLHLHWRIARPSLGSRQIDRFLDLVPGAPAGLRPRVFTRSSETPRSPTLAVAPGARHAPKAWPLERFAEVALRWNHDHRGRVLLLGSESELCAQLKTWLSGEVEVDDRSGSRDLRDLARDLASADRLVCNDSGLLHLAEAVGTPVVAVFGPTTREWGYFPLDPRSRVVETELSCRPCSRNGSRACGLSTRLCMELLSPDEVFEALEASR